MKSFEELQRLWQTAPPPPRGKGVVRGICLRRGAGKHETPAHARLTVAEGVVGDRWRVADDPERLAQVTLMNATAADSVAFADTPPHAAGDNFYVDLDVGESALPVGAQLRLGTALLEVTAEPHLGCKKFNERFGSGALRWVNHKDHLQLRLRGVNLRVVEDGAVSVGDRVEVVSA